MAMEEENHDSRFGFRELILNERKKTIQEIEDLALQYIEFLDIRGKLESAIKNDSDVIMFSYEQLQAAPFYLKLQRHRGKPIRESRPGKALLRMVELLDEEGIRAEINLVYCYDEDGNSLSPTKLSSPKIDQIYSAEVGPITLHF